MDEERTARRPRRPAGDPDRQHEHDAKITVDVNHRVDVHIHDERPGSQAILQDILTKLGVLQQQGRTTVGKIEDMRTELVGINEATNRQAVAAEAIKATQTEIAADVEALIAKAEAGGLTDADVQALRDIKAKADTGAADAEATAAFLRGVADRYTPDAEPPIEG